MLPRALSSLFLAGLPRDSRNGPVLKFPQPVLLTYEHPCERVMFHPLRNANPFFHFFESLWMLAGREDVAYLAQFVKSIKNYSDDSTTFYGAYGRRWVDAFWKNQLNLIVAGLKANPDCRRQVLQMWSAALDLGTLSKDLPCNTHAYFAINEGRLDMTVCNRSNDLVWGALGANCVHFSFLLEYLAVRIGVPVGAYYQFTNNLHGYLNTAQPLKELTNDQGGECPYSAGQVRPRLLQQDELAGFEEDIKRLDTPLTWTSPFMRTVAYPMIRAWENYKAYGPEAGFEAAAGIAAEDWSRACVEWLQRRAAAANDGVRHD